MVRFFKLNQILNPLQLLINPKIMEKIIYLKIGIFIFLMILGNSLMAQDVQVSGQVTNESDEPIPGATVLMEGTTTGTATDMYGKYALSVPPDAILIFSFIGYAKQEVQIGNRSVIDVTLTADYGSLEEVVVVGYGTQNKVDLTGSVASVTSKDIQIIPTERWDQAIQGRAAGVMVRSSSYKPGAGQSITIRGINSISGSNAPLVVIDGIIGANMNSIDANDIESIDILKDAAAASIYGSRGANGVILVTTRAGKIGKPSVNFDSYYGISEPTNVLEMMNAEEYMEYVNDARQRNGASLAYPDIDGVVNQIGEGTNWWDEMLGKGSQQKYYLSVNGGTENVTYMVTVGYQRTDGLLSTVDFSRFNSRFNVSAQISERLKLTGAFTYTSTTNNSYYDNSWPKHVTTMVGLRYPPVVSPRDDRGNLIPLLDNPFETGSPKRHTNVIYNLENEIRESLANNLLFNFMGEYKFTEFLKYDLQVGLEPGFSESRFFRPSDAVVEIDASLQSFSTASKDYNRNNQWLVENYLTFEKTFNGLHQVTAIAGTSAQGFKFESTSASARDFPFDQYGFHNLGTGISTLRGVGSGFSEEQLASYFYRANYAFNDKYLFQVNGRYDGSSKFAPGNKWAFFPSGSLGWRLSEENFIKNLGVFDNLKARVSYGSIGSHGIGRYATLQRIGGESYGYGFGGVPVGVYQPIGIANKDLKWETTTQLDVGVDIGFMDDRLSLTMDYYHKKTTDLILNRNISLINYPHRNHEPSITSNIGSLQNKGFEFAINYAANPIRNFRWSVNLNGTFQSTTLLDLALQEGTDFLLFGDNLRRQYQILEEGKPYGNYVGYETDGLYQTQEEINGSAEPNALPGDMKYIDQNGDGVINADDFVVLGNAIPDFFGGFTTNLSYKSFDLSFFLFSMLGHSIFNYDAYNWKYGLSTTEYNKIKEVATQRWTGPGTSNDIPRAGYKPINITDGPQGALDRMVENASFLRLRNVTLTYNLPQNLIKGLENARVYIQGQNLHTFTGFSGVDPEIDQMGGSTTLLPMNYAYYPAVKTYLVGINLGF
jgi:TonB-linked SusC/RagA family outer membrane protein